MQRAHCTLTERFKYMEINPSIFTTNEGPETLDHSDEINGSLHQQRTEELLRFYAPILD